MSYVVFLTFKYFFMKSKMKHLNQIFSLFLIVSFVGCTGARVSTDKTASVDLSKYKTFAYLPMLKDSADQSSYNYEAESRFMDQIGEEMRELGYSTNVDNPDLLVYARAQFNQEEDLEAEPVYNSYNYYNYGYGPAFGNSYYYNDYTSVSNVAGYDLEEVEYGEGTMVVDLIDAKTNKIVWRGTAKDEAFSVDALQNNLSTYADEIFEEYPVEEKGS